MKYATIHDSFVNEQCGTYKTVVFYKWWEEGSQEIHKSRAHGEFEHQVLGEGLLSQKGYCVLSQDEWENLVLPELDEHRMKLAQSEERYSLQYRCKAQEEEAEFLRIAQEKYPIEKMEAELRDNPNPTFVQALKRGMSWAPSITGDGADKKPLEDGSIASSTMGALLIGCYGINVKMPNSLHEIHEKLVPKIKFLMTKGGKERKCINRFFRSSTGSGRGARLELIPWYSAIQKDGYVARTSHLDVLRKLDQNLWEAVQEENARYSHGRA